MPSNSNYANGYKSSSKWYKGKDGKWHIKKSFQKGSSPYQKKANKCLKDTNQGIVHVVRGPTPTQADVKLKVTGSGFLIIPIGQSNHVEPLSTLFDPGAPSTLFTQQPAGFDQWSTMFQRFTVLACAIKVTAKITQQDIANDDNLFSLTVLPSTMTLAQVRAAADNGGATGTGEQCALENDRFAKTKFFSRPDANADTFQIKHYIASRTLYPNKEIEDDPDFTGTTASFTTGLAAPVATGSYYGILQSTAAVTAIRNCTFRISVTYYTRFSSPVNVYDV